MRKIGKLIYGDKSYYWAHAFIGIVVIAVVCAFEHFILSQPLNVFLNLISGETIGLSASLLGFQLTGVSVLISFEGNKKLSLLRKIESDTMIFKIFISSTNMFLLSIITMLISLNLFSEQSLGCCSNIKGFVDYISVVFFVYGFVFLFSSIRLLKWFCSN